MFLIPLAGYVYELDSPTHSIYKSQSGEIYKSVSGCRRQSCALRFINLSSTHSFINLTCSQIYKS